MREVAKGLPVALCCPMDVLWSCTACRGEKEPGWLCETHRDKSWGHDGCGGAGAPCICNPRGEFIWQTVHARNERPASVQWAMHASADREGQLDRRVHHCVGGRCPAFARDQVLHLDRAPRVARAQGRARSRGGASLAPATGERVMANTAPYVHDPGRHCVYCQHVVVRVLIPPRNGYTRGLGCVKNPGHAGEEQYSVCCDFRREPGSNDECLVRPTG